MTNNSINTFSLKENTWNFVFNYFDFNYNLPNDSFYSDKDFPEVKPFEFYEDLKKHIRKQFNVSYIADILERDRDNFANFLNRSRNLNFDLIKIYSQENFNDEKNIKLVESIIFIALSKAKNKKQFIEDINLILQRFGFKTSLSNEILSKI